MSARRKLVPAVLVLAALATGIAWYAKRETGAAQEKINALTRDIAEAQLRDDRLHASLVAARAAQTQWQATLSARRGADAAAEAMRTRLARASSTDPAVVRRYRDYRRSTLAVKYAALFERLGLSADQARKFEDSELSRQEAAQKLAALMSSGPANDPDAAGALRQQIADAVAAQKSLLGESGYAQLDTYNQEWWPRAVVSDMAGAATLAGLPLSGDQVTRLGDIVVQASRASIARQAGTFAGIDWDSIDQQARAFLTPAQLDFIRSSDVPGPAGAGGRYFTRLIELVNQAGAADARAATDDAAPAPWPNR